MNWVAKHFGRHLARKPWDFCWRIGIESVMVSLIPSALLSIAFYSPHRRFQDLAIPHLFILAVLVAPILETLIFQAFPIFIVRRLKGSIRIQVLVSTFLFSAAHFSEGIAVGVSAGVTGGLYLAFAYAHWRSQSRWSALWITTVCHSIRNGVVVIALVVLGYLFPDEFSPSKVPVSYIKHSPDFAPQLNAAYDKFAAGAKGATKESFAALLGAPHNEDGLTSVWEIRYDDKNYDSLSVEFYSDGHVAKIIKNAVRSKSGTQ